MTTNHSFFRALSTFSLVAAVATLSACTPAQLGSTMGGSGSVSVTSPEGAWPEDFVFDGAQWSHTRVGGTTGGTSIRIDLEDVAWRFSAVNQAADECCDPTFGFSVSLSEYHGPGSYDDDVLTVGLSDDEGWIDDFEADTYEPGRTMLLASAVGCTLTIDEDDLIGSLSCDEVEFAIDGEPVPGPHQLEADWENDPTPYEEAPFASG